MLIEESFLMDPIRLLITLLIIGVIGYVGIVFFIEMVKTLWNLSPLTSIGFVVSVAVAIVKGHISIDKMDGNLRILLFIFVGTVISYAAISLISNMIGVALAGSFASAAIILLVILALWFKGQEIKGWE